MPVVLDPMPPGLFHLLSGSHTLIDLPEPQFLHLYNEDDNICLTGDLGGLMS